MRERLQEILKEKEQFIQDNETIILIKNREMIAQYNNGEELCEVNGIINKRLEWLLDCLHDENKDYCKSLEESYIENAEFDEQMAEELMCVSFEVDNILYDNDGIEEDEVTNLHEKMYNQESLDIQKTVEYLKEMNNKGE